MTIGVFLLVLKTVGVFIASVCLYAALSFLINGFVLANTDREGAVVFAVVWTCLFLYKKLRKKSQNFE